ncbi:hypothetical protein ACES2I_15360 [Bdellovibrio bacteriovorus]|uniref:hypothetical protein n=1 Tax=Bdellovibrio bacteriovorus TaxID=959 RepID=UPI0035A60BCE
MVKTLLGSFVTICVLLAAGCSGGNSGSESSFPYSNSRIYFKNTAKISMEIYYETGSEPFTGTTLSGMNYWQILEDNLTAIFQYRNTAPTITVPKSLAEMTAIPAQGKTEWTGIDIVNLHKQYHSQLPTSAESRFYLYFLDGNYSTGSGPETGVIGVSLGGTPIIAIFKDVVRSSGANPNGIVPKYVEQSTLVHEMGHALGFVNNGVPMVTAHQDTAHGAHSTNSDCVMYWLNEGASDLSNFLQNYISSGDTVMWGPEVLQDAQAYSE